MGGGSNLLYCSEIILPSPKGLLGQYWVTLDTDLPFFDISGPDMMNKLPNKPCVAQGKSLEVLLVNSGDSGMLFNLFLWCWIKSWE